MTRPFWKTAWEVLKPKHETAVWCAKFILGDSCQRNESSSTHRNLSMNVITALFAIREGEMTEIFQRWIVKLWCMQSMEQKVMNNWSIQWPAYSSKGLCSWNGPIPMASVMCYSISITFLKWQNYRYGDQISGCQGLKRWQQEENRCSYLQKQHGEFV